jgi:DNA-binding transcriptional MocR family regulator
MAVPQRPEHTFGLQIDAQSKVALQSQIRQQLIEGIFAGRFQPDRRLPSSRRLSEALGVARNTVLLACQTRIIRGCARALISCDITMVFGPGMRKRLSVAEPRPGSRSWPGMVASWWRCCRMA